MCIVKIKEVSLSVRDWHIKLKIKLGAKNQEFINQKLSIVAGHIVHMYCFKIPIHNFPPESENVYCECSL